MTLEKFFELDEINSFSFEDALTLNQNLSEKRAFDIPLEHREKLMSYLLIALNMNSVNMNSIDLNVRKSLGNLLSELQELA
jgi:hypothetical protein